MGTQAQPIFGQISTDDVDFLVAEFAEPLTQRSPQAIEDTVTQNLSVHALPGRRPPGTGTDKKVDPTDCRHAAQQLLDHRLGEEPRRSG